MSSSYYDLLANRSNPGFNMIDNYLYMYHIGYDPKTGQKGSFVVLPTYPEQIQDSLGSTFAESTPLARSAPIYSYSRSGPRSMTITLQLHRDMMTQINYGVSNLNVELGDDYVDTIIKSLQACALPTYSAVDKMIDPPLVSLRFGNEIFIKGIINGAVSVTYKLPILDDNKYAQVEVSFQIYEVDPYDAQTVMEKGSFYLIFRRIYVAVQFCRKYQCTALCKAKKTVN